MGEQRDKALALHRLHGRQNNEQRAQLALGHLTPAEYASGIREPVTGFAASRSRTRGRRSPGTKSGSTHRWPFDPRSASAKPPPSVVDLPSPEHVSPDQRITGMVDRTDTFKGSPKLQSPLISRLV